jgi:hypothetical protein
MIAHSVSKRSAKALPQVESTVSLSITAKLMKFVARQDFVVGNCHVKAGETCFAVQSERRPGRFYIVRFNSERAMYQCSCGANCCEHEHLKTVREYVMSHVVVPAKVESAKVEQKVESPEIPQMTTPLTAAEWREIMKRDKARQKAEKAADWAKIEEARAQGKREMEVGA